MSPDPSGLSYADLNDPQSFNLYTYALNNPLKYTDPTGMYCYYGDPNSVSDGFDKSQYDFHSSSSECTAKDKNGNSGQWISDAQTHQNSDGSYADNDGRMEEAVSGQATAPVKSILDTVLPNMRRQDRVSLQYSTPFLVQHKSNYNPNLPSMGAYIPPPPVPKPTALDCMIAPDLANDIYNIRRGIRNPSQDTDGVNGIGVGEIYAGGNLKGGGPLNNNLTANAQANGAALAADYFTSYAACRTIP